MSFILFDHVTHRFGNNVVALSDLSLSIEPGEFVFLVGPSGSGKTTFVRLLIRELLPSEGKIFLDGEEISRKKGVSVANLRRKVGVSFQDSKLLKDLTVEENVTVMLEILGTPKDKRSALVEAALDLVELKDRARDFPIQLSGGEVQRVAIARSVVGDPLVVFADEPTANLDDETGWKIVSLLKEVNRSGRTVIVATHNMDVVRSMGERVIRLEKGKLVDEHHKVESVETLPNS